MKIGIIGLGAMGSGIAQVAAMAGETIYVFDNNATSIAKAKTQLQQNLEKLVEKGKISSEKSTQVIKNHVFTDTLDELLECELVIEAIVEDLSVKKQIFHRLESIVSPRCILASNTSSLSIASIASACQHQARVMGIHFFNPAPIMPLVEIIPSISTHADTIKTATEIIKTWGKTTVLAKDTPGFIVNKVARPFYGEALRIYDEGIADFVTIDWAMREFGGFKMGPFELMDFIGNDVNYAVTESVFKAFYYDPRYKPSLTQKRLAEAGWLGKKTGRGYYNYAENMSKPEPKQDPVLGKAIFTRILAMLINEAYDTLFWNIATPEDIDLAVTKGVNYPKGLLAWSEEIGKATMYQILQDLYNKYQEDRYRPCVLLKG